MRLLRNDVNRGKGYSIRRGMLEARGDLRLMCDADCAPSLASLADMERAAAEVDVAVGSRLGPGARVERQQAVRRRIVGAGFIALTRLGLGRLPRDIYCGFKLWRADCAEAVFSQVRLEGWVFDAEALAMARRMGFTMREVGIEWSNRPDSRLSIRAVLLPVIGELWRARRNVRRAAVAYRRAGPGGCAPPKRCAEAVHWPHWSLSYQAGTAGGSAAPPRGLDRRGQLGLAAEAGQVGEEARGDHPAGD